MICTRGGHVAHPDREMDRVQRRTTGACPCHPWVKTRLPSTDTPRRRMRRGTRAPVKRCVAEETRAERPMAGKLEDAPLRCRPPLQGSDDLPRVYHRIYAHER
jgi:hypothetical protein